MCPVGYGTRMARNFGFNPADPDLTLGDLEDIVNRAKQFGADRYTRVRQSTYRGAPIVLIEIQAAITRIPQAKRREKRAPAAKRTVKRAVSATPPPPADAGTDGAAAQMTAGAAKTDAARDALKASFTA